jgi:hypothetical protein
MGTRDDEGNEELDNFNVLKKTDTIGIEGAKVYETMCKTDDG